MKINKTSLLAARIVLAITLTLLIAPISSHGAAKTKPMSKSSVEKIEKSEFSADYIFWPIEWSTFPWEEPKKSKLLAMQGYAEKQDLEGNVISSLTVKETPIGQVTVDAYSRTQSDPSTLSKIVIHLGADAVNREICREQQNFLTSRFGKPTAERDVSTPDLNDFAVQWVIDRTVAVWRCIGVNTAKRWSFITFSNSADEKLFSELIPLSCVTRTRFDDGDIKTYELQLIVDPYAAAVRRTDNSIISTASDVHVSERGISYLMTDKKYSSTVEIDRGTGRYKEVTLIHTLNTRVETTGLCELFDPKRRKF